MPAVLARERPGDPAEGLCVDDDALLRRPQEVGRHAFKKRLFLRNDVSDLELGVFRSLLNRKRKHLGRNREHAALLQSPRIDIAARADACRHVSHNAPRQNNGEDVRPVIKRFGRTVGAETILEEEEPLRFAAALQYFSLIDHAQSPVLAKELNERLRFRGKEIRVCGEDPAHNGIEEGITFPIIP